MKIKYFKTSKQNKPRKCLKLKIFFWKYTLSLEIDTEFAIREVWKKPVLLWAICFVFIFPKSHLESNRIIAETPINLPLGSRGQSSTWFRRRIAWHIRQATWTGDGNRKKTGSNAQEMQPASGTLVLFCSSWQITWSWPGEGEGVEGVENKKGGGRRIPHP